MKNTIDVRKVTLVGFGMALNLVGGFIALTLKLPIYLDSIGTILIACLLGPQYAVLTGIGGNIIGGLTLDVYSLYFTPGQISTGLIAGLMYRKGWLQGKKTPLGVLAFALPTSMIGAVIAAGLFGGITSSGSSYIAQVLKQLGIPDVMSVFITQAGTDYLDKYIAVLLVLAAIKVLPKSFKAIQNNASIGRQDG